MARLPTSVRTYWPHLLLVVSFGMAGLVALQAHEARKAQAATAREALQDYASFVSWSFAQHAASELEDAFWEVLEPMNHGEALHVSREIPPAENLAHHLEWDSAGCYCHVPAYLPRAFFSFRVGDDSLDVAANVHRGPSRGVRVEGADPSRFPPGVSDDPDPRRYSPAERSWIVDSLATHARTRYRREWRVAVLPRPAPGGISLYGYTLMPTAWGDTLVYGMELPPSESRLLFARVLEERSLLPETFVRSRANREIVHAAVGVRGDRTLFTTGPFPDGGLDDETLLSERFGFLRLRTAIAPEFAEELIIGGVPASRLPLMLGILAVAAALAVVSVGQLRREGELGRLRTDFVSAVSHELRTPLTQIRLYLETLRLGRFRTPEQREDALERIDRETGRLAHLVENILQFGRSEHGTGSSTPSLLALEAEIRDAVETFAPLARAADAEVVAEVDAEVAVRADRRELRQVLINLLDNAIKYGPPGQTLTVRGELEGGRVRIEVEDEGSGVPVRERERIWEPFRRGSGVAERAVGGSGIGLAVVREIVRRHGGDAWVEDGAGGGARFVVTVPGERVFGGGARSAGTRAPLTPRTRTGPSPESGMRVPTGTVRDDSR